MKTAFKVLLLFTISLTAQAEITENPLIGRWQSNREKSQKYITSSFTQDPAKLSKIGEMFGVLVMDISAERIRMYPRGFSGPMVDSCQYFIAKIYENRVFLKIEAPDVGDDTQIYIASPSEIYVEMKSDPLSFREYFTKIPEVKPSKPALQIVDKMRIEDMPGYSIPKSNIQESIFLRLEASDYSLISIKTRLAEYIDTFFTQKELEEILFSQNSPALKKFNGFLNGESNFGKRLVTFLNEREEATQKLLINPKK